MATHRRLMTLLSKLGVDNDQRHELIANFTNGRTESTKDLYDYEVQELCTRLQGMLPDDEHKAQEELLVKKKRSVVLKIATDAGIHDTNDWSVFNGWMLRRSILKKPLHLYSCIELDELIKQMYSLRDNYERSALKFGNKAWWHNGGKVAGLN